MKEMNRMRRTMVVRVSMAVVVEMTPISLSWTVLDVV